jgi:hypothetical protein
MTALSIYFVMQALEAFAFRALLLGAVLWLGWRYAIGIGILAQTTGAASSGRSRESFRTGSGLA